MAVPKACTAMWTAAVFIFLSFLFFLLSISENNIIQPPLVPGLYRRNASLCRSLHLNRLPYKDFPWFPSWEFLFPYDLGYGAIYVPKLRYGPVPGWKLVPGFFEHQRCLLNVWGMSGNTFYKKRLFLIPPFKDHDLHEMHKIVRVKVGLPWSSTEYEQNYEHWFDQTAPMILAFKETLATYGEDAKLIVRTDEVSVFYREILKIFQVPEKHLMLVEPFTLILVERLIVAPMTDVKGTKPESMMFRLALHANVARETNCDINSHKKGRTKMLFLARARGGINNNAAGVKRRQIVNNDQLIQWAKEAGADVNGTVTLTLLEKASFFCKYECVVIQAGAGMVNFMLTPPSLKRVVIIAGAYNPSAYKKWLRKLGYEVVYAKTSYTGTVFSDNITVLDNPFRFCSMDR